MKKRHSKKKKQKKEKRKEVKQKTAELLRKKENATSSTSFNDDEFEITIKKDARLIPMQVRSSTTVAQIKEKIAEIGGKIKGSKLLYIGKVMGDDETLAHHKIFPSTIQVSLAFIMKSSGGSTVVNETEKKDNTPDSDSDDTDSDDSDSDFDDSKKKRVFDPLKYPEIPFTLEKKDDLMFVDDKNDPRVIMPCGHCFTSETINSVVDYILEKSLHRAECPVVECRKLWDWDFVVKSGMYSKEECGKILKVVNELKIHASGIRSCPNCKEFCFRPPELHMKRIKCSSCQGRDFCFSCGKNWLGGGFQLCGNKECPDSDLIDILHDCDKVTISGVPNVPKIRLCPGCTNIIEYVDLCKHMICTNPQCKYEFCFACLEKYPCQGTCVPKPIQVLK